MRRKPIKSKEDLFIENAQAHDIISQTSTEDIHQYVIREKWPISEEILTPSLSEGSNLRKPITLPLKEYEWNSIDRHTKTLGIQKSEWIRYAIFKLMQEEQAYFLQKHKNKLSV